LKTEIRQKFWDHRYADDPLSHIDDCFPKEDYRDGQREVIEFAVKAFLDGKKLVILECPTGSGKSPIGMAIANLSRNAYYLTITKILQDQLASDFSDITELKGRNAYPCTFYERMGDKLIDRKLMTKKSLSKALSERSNCDTGFCRKRKQGYKCLDCFTPNGPVEGYLEVLPAGSQYSACPYYEQVYQAINNHNVVMNFSSFLYQTQMTKRFDEPRGMLVIDECHNVEPQLLDFVSVTLNDIQLQKHGVEIPEYDNAYKYAEWYADHDIPNVLNQIIMQARESEDTALEDEIKRLHHKFQMFVDHVEESGSNWIVEYKEAGGEYGQPSHRSVTLKPIFIQNYADSLLFKYADRILMMSATVLDVGVMCKSLGLNRDEIAAYRMKNRFPVENRPIFIRPAARMVGGVKKMHSEWGDKLVTAVNDIMAEHSEERGIVHTHNFAIANLLKEKCDPYIRNRFFFQRDYYNNKKYMLEEHAKSHNGVIIAPAMHEGVDLYDDLSRFQIICKVPYANCFDDKQLAARVEVDRKYYVWLTALKLVQSYGRSVRSVDDWAKTYIIDEAIYKFLRDANKMLPDWFKEALIDEG